MIEIHIPGRGLFRLEHAVFDVNGTLAVDGDLLPRVKELLEELRQHVAVHMLTADTHGRQATIDAVLGFPAERIGTPEGKVAFVKTLGAARVVAIGNGANDAGMLAKAALGIAVLGPEGTAVEALQAADVVVSNIQAAIELLLYPQRLIATLRK